jgi:L-ascorbate metabolism protein UlaG (beta-lactamase superfamily)
MDNGKVIYTDPYQLKGPADLADLILISHDHYDHADANSIKAIFSSSKTKVICPKTCVGKLKAFNPIGLAPNESKDIEGIKITTVPAYNPNKQFHPKGNNWVGYVIEVAGKRLYHAGDTDVIPEMKTLGAIDVALLPVGDQFTMGFNDAVEACKIIKPKICVPMHDWNHDLNEFSNLVKKGAPSVKVEILKGKDLKI